MKVVLRESLPTHWNAWSGLRLFQNDEWVTEKLIEKHNIKKQYHPNAKKQAKQIRFCIAQAKEYWDASVISTIATSPLQLYYCCMSLAIAEVLWRGDGNSSIEKLREQNSHHGLEFSWGKSTLEFADIGKLRARPHIGRGGRSGTFELWHDIAKEGSLVGKQIDQMGGNNRTSASILFTASPNRLPIIPEAGLTLVELYASMPRMAFALDSMGVPRKTVRATVEAIHEDSNLYIDYLQERTVTLIVHPGDAGCIEALKNLIALSPSSIENISYQESGVGFVLIQKSYHNRNGSTGGFYLPDPISMGAATTYFKPHLPYLNEFGIMYAACFVLGMLCRYYPELWMKEIERNSSFLFLAQTFLGIVTERIPLLSLGSLDDAVYVNNDIGMRV